MFTSQVVKDITGQHYIIRLRNQGYLNLSIKPEKFLNAQLSYQFVCRLKTPFGLWQNIAASNSFFSLQRWQNSNPSLTIEHYAAQVLVQGWVEVYKTADVQPLQEQASKTSVKDSVGRGYQLKPASSLLLSNGNDIKTIKSQAQAQQFINQLSLDDDEISQLLKINNINSSKAPSEALVSALINGQLIVAVMPPERKLVATTEFVEQTVTPNDSGPAPVASTAAKKSPTEQVTTRNDKKTAEVLEKAAEAGTPFCEECQQEQDAA